MTYYFISDLHIGGEGDLDYCEFEPELINFLRFLETEPQPLELIIAGDTFSFWEITSQKGPAKLDFIIDKHPELFEQFRQSGSKYTITLIAGNHDYDLACYPEFVDKLAKHNLQLIQQEAITRKLGQAKIWIEHGSQHDEFNHSPDFGNPHANPAGYWITSKVVAAAGQKAETAKHPWLKDLQSVYPGELIPHWMFSNYFYKEMGWWLKALFYPFLTLIFLTLLAMLGEFLESLDILPTQIFGPEWASQPGITGAIGRVTEILTIITVFYFLAALAISLPFVLVFLDIKQTLKRYGLTNIHSFNKLKYNRYAQAAESVFANNLDIKVFVYGHTHRPQVIKLDNRVIINTGTWLKKLNRIPARFFFLPDIYYPSYCLNYFRVSQTKSGLTVDYEVIPKNLDLGELTLFQRLLIPRRKLKKLRAESVPKQTEVRL